MLDDLGLYADVDDARQVRVHWISANTRWRPPPPNHPFLLWQDSGLPNHPFLIWQDSGLLGRFPKIFPGAGTKALLRNTTAADCTAEEDEEQKEKEEEKKR